MYKVTYRYRLEKRVPSKRSKIIMTSDTIILSSLENMEDAIDQDLAEQYDNNPDMLGAALLEIVGYIQV